MSPQPYLDHVQVAAPPGCEAQARRFFGELLDLPEIVKPAVLLARGGAWFALAGGLALHVGVTDAFTPARQAHPALRYADAVALREVSDRLAAGGVPVWWADPVEIPDVTRFFCEDPWGNRLELLAPAG
jgi:hypothetical protein